MEACGIGWALILDKALVGLFCGLIAYRGAAAIHANEPWIWRIPMLPAVRRWMRSGERSWIALLPLYGVAAAQILAAAAWLLAG